jgi:hypothetical protein
MMVQITHPPQLQRYNISHSTVLRFTASSAVALTITSQNLLDAILVAATATTGFELFEAVRIRHVEVWASPLLGSSVVTQVIFNGTTERGDWKIHEDTSMGVQPAHVKAKPSPRCLASLFQDNSPAANLFSLVCPAGSVIDVALTFNGTFAVGNAVQNALVAATAGATYLRGLDGLPTATTILPPAVQSAFVI